MNKEQAHELAKAVMDEMYNYFEGYYLSDGGHTRLTEEMAGIIHFQQNKDQYLIGTISVAGADRAEGLRVARECGVVFTSDWAPGGYPCRIHEDDFPKLDPYFGLLVWALEKAGT